MKIYFANMLSIQNVDHYLERKINVLSSYTSFPKKRVMKPKFCDSLFVDSGAFGKNSSKINLENYIDFIKEHKDIIEVYSNLDVIGDAEGTWKNQQIMERAGLSPLPVFHYGSSVKYLQDYISKGYSYISLGGMVPVNSSQLQFWLDRLWRDYLTDDKGFPIIKVHGFGLQIASLLTRYPWYSVDASSVHVLARFGGIYTPWGTFKINPNVNAKELKWQTPLRFQQVCNFVNNLGFAFSFEEAQEQSVEGTHKRCCISILYFTQWLEENKVEKFSIYKNASLVGM